MRQQLLCEFCGGSWDGGIYPEFPTVRVCFQCNRKVAISLAQILDESFIEETLKSNSWHPIRMFLLDGNLYPIQGGGRCYNSSVIQRGEIAMNELTPVIANIETFKAQLAKLDELIKQDAVTPIDGIQLTEARGCVASVMKDIQAHPELDSILIDNDIHNIVAYVRKTAGIFSIQREEKAVKRDTRTTKAAATSAGAAVVADAFAKMGINLFGAPPTAVTPAGKPKRIVSDEDKAAFAELLGGFKPPAVEGSQGTATASPTRSEPDSPIESPTASVSGVTPDSEAARAGPDSRSQTGTDPLASFKNFLAKKGG